MAECSASLHIIWFL